MKWTTAIPSLVGLGVIVAQLSLAQIELHSPFQGISFQRAKATHDRTPESTSPNRQALKRFRGSTSGHNAASVIAAAEKDQPGAGYQNISALGPYGTQYAVEVEWDNELIQMIFDTGSSDTWAVKSDFVCTSELGNTEYPQEACRFGDDLVDDFKYGTIPDIHFRLRYGSGERIAGPMGFSDISVAGITVERVQVGLANSTHWYGNDVTQGVLGMAYPSLTSAYSGGPHEDRSAFSIPYAPFFTSMVQKGLVASSFSVALVRNSSEGVIAWGGRTGVPTTKPYARTDLIVAQINPSVAESAWAYSYYTIIPDGVQWGQTTDMTKHPYIVDTGTTLTFMPPPIAESIARAFDPPAMYLFSYGSYFVRCDAVAPRLAIIIEGCKFWFNPVDMVYRTLVDELTGMCQIGITTGGPGPYILGMTFLQSVEVMFDVGAAELAFWGREFHGPTPRLPPGPQQ